MAYGPPSNFTVDNQNISDPVEIANNFCDYFTNIGPNLAKTIPRTSNSYKSFLTGNFVDSIFLDLTTEFEIINIVNSLRSGIAAGYDKISIWSVKDSSALISSPLSHIVNLSLKSGIVPDQLKIARVLPLFKSGDNNMLSNYRPISVLPIFSKIFEKVVYNRLITYFNKYNILFKNQYGFRKGHSTSLALHHLFDNITKAIDQKEYTIGVFIDLSKAFDTVNHEILINKLKHYGIRGLALDWIKSYFGNRQQYVEYNGAYSSYNSIKCGVPQGSILGPLLFLIYINDLCNASNIVELILFADDTNIFFSHNNLPLLMNIINSEMNKLSEWFRANKLSINAKKSNYMIFRPRQKRQILDLTLELNGYKIDQVKEVMFLGVILDECMTWKPHISHVASKISKSVGIIHKSSFCLSKSALRLLYYALVYPYLQYCITVWGSTYPSNLYRIVLIQKRVIRVISKEAFDAHTDPIFQKLCILKFTDVYLLQLGTFMYKYKKNLLPLTFDNSFIKINQIHTYNTRTSKQYYIPTCRTKIRQFSASYQGPLFFNSLSSDICDASTVSLFQSKLKMYLFSIS